MQKIVYEKIHSAEFVGSIISHHKDLVYALTIERLPCNFLILDEPTNHLDVQAKDALKEALKNFAGTVLLVSHEENFYNGWVHRVISIEK